MNYPDDSEDFTIPSSSSSQHRLLSETLPSQASSHRTGHGGDDLSLSELSLSFTPVKRAPKFSLLPPRREDDSLDDSVDQSQMDRYEDDYEEAEEHQEYDQDGEPIDDHTQRLRKDPTKAREEKLQNDMFVLKKMNESLASWLDTLEDTSAVNDQISQRLNATERLLNKYVSILSTQEKFTRLLSDEEWEGATADEAEIQRLAEEARRKETERRLAEQREREARERAEQERIEREERLRIEAEQKAKGRGTIRGVRGTRASMRGVRGASPSFGSGRGSTPPNAKPSRPASSVPKKPPSSASSSSRPASSTRGGYRGRGSS